MMRRKPRRQRTITQVRAEWDEDFRATTGASPGGIRISVNDDTTGTFAEIEVGTGDVPDLIRLLEDACSQAQASLDLTPDQQDA